MNTNKLKDILEEEGITVAEFSRKSGISQGSIYRYCDGADPKVPFKGKICRAINSLIGHDKYKVTDIFPE
jgi:predicted transcriptional regulator